MFNKIVIIGRLGFPPSSKTTKSGTQLCSFTVAVNTGWGESKQTDWYAVSVFGKQADVCSRTLQKGSLVCVTGSLQLREYEGKDGQKKARLELTADNVTFLDSKEKHQTQEQSYKQAEDVFEENDPNTIPF